jgi:hydrogenase small subunit
MKISRRDFLKWSVAATVALKLHYDLDRFNTVLADDSNPPVIWLQGSKKICRINRQIILTMLIFN